MEHAELKKVAVVGGGLAGLVAAERLSQYPVQVTLFERASTCGGRASTSSINGFSLNLGPHALYRAGAAFRYLSQRGIEPAGASPKFRKAVALTQNTCVEVPLSLTSLISTNVLDLGEKVELVSVLSKVKGMQTEPLMAMSVAQWLDTTARSARVRAVLGAIVRLSTYCADFTELSAGAAIKQIALTTGGVIYVDNGWQSIVESLRSIIIANKVRLRTGSQVTAVSSKAGLVEVATQNTTEGFDAVILAVPPVQFRRLLADACAIDPDRFLRSRVATLDVCLSSLPVKETTFALGIDEPIYYSVHSIGGKLAPDGGAVIHLAAYLQSAGAVGEQYETRLLEVLERLQPGWEKNCVFRRFVPDMVASFGTPAAVQAGCSGVANPDATGVPRVFACGDWVGTSSFLADASVSSAISAADLVLEELQRTPQEFRPTQAAPYRSTTMTDVAPR